MYSSPDKAFSGAVLAFSAAALAIARSLHPSASGMGTHEQLGLPPCKFLVFTGFPCPSCGLTTSFAYAAHFHFQQAFFASPFGLLLFFGAVLVIPTSAVLLWRRTSWQQMFERLNLTTITGWMVVAYLISWIYKITAVSVTARFLAGQ
jgi:hypothetical protein